VKKTLNYTTIKYLQVTQEDMEELNIFIAHRTQELEPLSLIFERPLKQYPIIELDHNLPAPKIELKLSMTIEQPALAGYPAPNIEFVPSISIVMPGLDNHGEDI
jgi:hypothetical protein